MKKLVFLLITALGVTLTGCSNFNSDPVEPEILGIGNLQYDAQSELWFVVIDSTQYNIVDVTIPSHNPRSYSVTQSIEPVEGMLVTAFTSPHMKGIQVVAGIQSVEQIEKLYRVNSKLALILCGLLLLCVMGISALPKAKQIPE
jgi:hypothetical protein